MIKRYRDHAANERTYLAWIRTGITIMLLGFFFERFDLFLGTLSRTLQSSTAGTEPHHTGYVGLGLAALGLAVMIWATARFVLIKRRIDQEKDFLYHGSVFSLSLTALMLGFGVYLLLVLVHLI